MNNVIDQILEKAGRNNMYQYVALLLLFVLYGSSEYIIVILPFLEAKPKVEFFDNASNSTIVTTINYTICENFNYSIVQDLTKHSLIYELGIYCDKTLTTVLGICLFSGVMIGSSIAYIFVDRKGRKVTLQVFSTLLIILNIVLYFIDMLIPVFIIMFLYGLFSSIINITILVYVSEIIKKQNLVYFMSTIFCAFSFFGAIYTVIFYYTSEWRDVVLLVLVNMVITIPLIHFYLEESPIFYFSHRNDEMFFKTVQKIANKNGRVFDLAQSNINNFIENDLKNMIRPSRVEENYNSDAEEKSVDRADLSDHIFIDNQKETLISKNNKDLNESSSITNSYQNSLQRESFKPNSLLDISCLIKEKEKRRKINDYSICDLITLESQRINFLILNYIWIVITFMFCGLSINVKNLYGNFYATYFFIFLCDPICSFAGAFLSNNSLLGRKKTMISLLLLSFCGFMTSIFFDQDPDSEFFSVFMYISRISLIALNCVFYCYTNEIYPTVLRTRGLGFHITLSKMGGIVAPFMIEYFGTANLCMIYCLLNLFAIMFSFMLPETLNRRMAFYPPEMSGIVEENFD